MLVVNAILQQTNSIWINSSYKELIKNSSKPIIIYDIPGRSVIQMTDNTMAELAKSDIIAGVKDATADLARPTRLQTQLAMILFNYLVKMEQL